MNKFDMFPRNMLLNALYRVQAILSRVQAILYRVQALLHERQ